MKKRILAILGSIAVIIGTVAGLSACSGSGSSTQQNATQLLQGDGYTPSSAYTNALQGGLDSSSAVTSSQAGTNSSGDVQAVIVFDNAADEQAGADGAQSTLSGSGITLSSSGDVLTATGPVAAWASVG